MHAVYKVEKYDLALLLKLNYNYITYPKSRKIDINKMEVGGYK